MLVTVEPPSTPNELNWASAAGGPQSNAASPRIETAKQLRFSQVLLFGTKAELRRKYYESQAELMGEYSNSPRNLALIFQKGFVVGRSARNSAVGR